MSPGIVKAQFLLFLLFTLDHNIPQNLHFFVFNNNFWSMFIPFVTSFHVIFPTKFPMEKLAKLSCLLLYSFCANFSHLLTIWDIPCVSHSLFELPVLAQHTTWLPFQISSQLFLVSAMFHFHLLFLAFLLQTVHTLFCFPIVPSLPSANSIWIPSYLLYQYILLFLKLSHLQSMAQLNSWHTIPIFFVPSLYIPQNLSIPFLPFPCYCIPCQYHF